MLPDIVRSVHVCARAQASKPLSQNVVLVINERPVNKILMNNENGRRGGGTRQKADRPCHSSLQRHALPLDNTLRMV
jgi:hypothetical protein